MRTVTLFTQPIKPMLAKTAKTIPEGDFAYEPKWDGFRVIVMRDGRGVELQSRSGKPLTRYFPELIEATQALPAECVLDGEIVLRTGEAGAEHLSWDLLSSRIHPAESRIEKLSADIPAEIVFFDALHLGRDLTGEPYRARREALDALFDPSPGPGLHLSAMTTDHGTASDWFETFEGAGLDGIIAKPLDGLYDQGKRSMVKVKHKRTAEAVVVGYRVHKDGTGVGSLLLGMFHDDELVRVGGIVSLPKKTREKLIEELAPLVMDDLDPSLESAPSRFSSKDDAEIVPLRPDRVVEVAFDQLEGNRFRHAATFLRWRPDREPRSCGLDQVDRAMAYDLGQVLTA